MTCLPVAPVSLKHTPLASVNPMPQFVTAEPLFTYTAVWALPFCLDGDAWMPTHVSGVVIS